MNFDIIRDRSRVFAFLTGCWALYLVATPFQIFASGYPQPVDILMTAPIFSVLCLYGRQVSLTLSPVFVLLFLFAGLTCIINLTWFAFYRERIFLLSSAFYVFNAAIFSLGVYIFKNDSIRAQKWTLIACVAAIILELAWTGWHEPLRSGRAEGSFNNPNQMAYWALTTLLCVLALRQNKRFGWFDVFTFAGCGMLIVSSLSKAGLAAFVLTALIIACSSRVKMAGRFGFLIALIALAGLVWTPALSKIPLLEHAVMRMQTIGTDPDDTLEARGYTRLLTHPQYMLFGAGEGGFGRFVPYGRALEIHSGFANLLFCYGILGLGLFTAFLLHVFRKSPPHIWMLLAPVVLHSLTHQTFRFTTFWVFLALVHAMTAMRPRASMSS